MLTFVTRLRPCLPGFSPVQLVFFPFRSLFFSPLTFKLTACLDGNLVGECGRYTEIFLLRKKLLVLCLYACTPAIYFLVWKNGTCFPPSKWPVSCTVMVRDFLLRWLFHVPVLWIYCLVFVHYIFVLSLLFKMILSGDFLNMDWDIVGKNAYLLKSLQTLVTWTPE